MVNREAKMLYPVETRTQQLTGTSKRENSIVKAGRPGDAGGAPLPVCSYYRFLVFRDNMLVALFGRTVDCGFSVVAARRGASDKKAIRICFVLRGNSIRRSNLPPKYIRKAQWAKTRKANSPFLICLRLFSRAPPESS